LLAALCTGAGLSVAGAVLQALLRNPLAEPYLLGTSSGAGVGTLLGMLLGVGSAYLPASAFLGALAAMILVYYLARDEGRFSTTPLILSGIIVGIGFTGIMVCITSLFGHETVPGITWWLLGSLQVYDPVLISVVGLIVLLSSVFFFFNAHALNALCLGEEEAIHAGIPQERFKKTLFIIASLMTGAIVSMTGVIGFVGLIVPHAMRLYVGSHHRVLIPACALGGAAFLIFCDFLSRVVAPPVEIPIGVITSLIGAPLFMILFKHKKRS